MRSFVKWILLIVAGFLGLICLPVLPRGFAAYVTHLPTGWIHFLQRHLADMTVNWVMVATAIALFAVLLCGSHWLLGTLHRQARQQRDPNTELRPWPWRWTISLFFSLGMVFAVAFGATGVYRQVSWLRQYQDAWYEERLYPSVEFRIMSSDIELFAAEYDRDLDATKEAILKNEGRRSRGPILENYSILLYAKSDRKLAAYVIIPRKQNMLKFGQFASTATPDLVQPLTELEATLRKFDQEYPIKR